MSYKLTVTDLFNALPATKRARIAKTASQLVGSMIQTDSRIDCTVHETKGFMDIKGFQFHVTVISDASSKSAVELLVVKDGKGSAFAAKCERTQWLVTLQGLLAHASMLYSGVGFSEKSDGWLAGYFPKKDKYWML